MSLFNHYGLKSLSILAIATLGFLNPVFGDSEKLPIGDGKISSTPQQGYLYSCQSRFNPNAGGAHANGNWISGNYWYPALKPIVDGDVKWSGGGVTVTTNGPMRNIISNNLPSHGTGIYPIKRNDDAYKYDRNPNRISSQNINLQIPATPRLAASPNCVPMGLIGISLTGAAIYNSVDARGDDAPAHEIQDKCAGHPERSGQYHYHGPSDCMVEMEVDASGHSGLIGYALDGFGIYGLKGKGGNALSNADLDACHGHSGKVLWDGSVTNMYHYHLTEEYPYTIGCFKGEISASIGQNNQDPSSRPPLKDQAGQQGPEAMLEIAAKELGVSINDLRRAIGPPPPNFKRAAQILGIPEKKIQEAMRRARDSVNY